ncbi:hypothetical protein BFZC1_11542 [Lysinibacillus fusiformis ZC1]|nr:hypothetical protein BFZC1_11542 [Lysinibacillus fusiformis ZC1]
MATIYYWVWARHHINEDAPEERFAKDATVQVEVQAPVSTIEAIRE